MKDAMRTLDSLLAGQKYRKPGSRHEYVRQGGCCGSLDKRNLTLTQRLNEPRCRIPTGSGELVVTVGKACHIIWFQKCSVGENRSWGRCLTQKLKHQCPHSGVPGFPANTDPEREQVMDQVTESLPSTWENWNKLLTRLQFFATQIKFKKEKQNRS